MQTPALRHLMAAYYHQDWYHEHQDEWANLEDFMTGEPLAARLADDVDEVLRELTTDAEVGRYLESLGSYYVPDPERGGHRAWLAEVGRRAQAHVRGE